MTPAAHEKKMQVGAAQRIISSQAVPGRMCQFFVLYTLTEPPLFPLRSHR
jgi:hypothetical protein